VWTVISWLLSPDCYLLTVISWLLSPDCYLLTYLLNVISWLLSPDCYLLTVISWLLSPDCYLLTRSASVGLSAKGRHRLNHRLWSDISGFCWKLFLITILNHTDPHSNQIYCKRSVCQAAVKEPNTAGHMHCCTQCFVQQLLDFGLCSTTKPIKPSVAASQYDV